jgi:hypothetical protein
MRVTQSTDQKVGGSSLSERPISSQVSGLTPRPLLLVGLGWPDFGRPPTARRRDRVCARSCGCQGPLPSAVHDLTAARIGGIIRELASAGLVVLADKGLPRRRRPRVLTP